VIGPGVMGIALLSEHIPGRGIDKSNIAYSHSPLCIENGRNHSMYVINYCCHDRRNGTSIARQTPSFRDTRVAG
jgi:hypothetical protein